MKMPEGRVGGRGLFAGSSAGQRAACCRDTHTSGSQLQGEILHASPFVERERVTKDADRSVVFL